MTYVVTGESCVDWLAKWIWKNFLVQVNDFALFRKEYSISKSVSSAKIFVSAHNHFELFINGSKVSGYVTPAPTHPSKSKYYLCYDIKSVLKLGMNAFCAVVHFIGGGGQNYVNGLPGFLLQCNVEYMDGTQDVLMTDESWKTIEETPYRNGTQFQQNRKISAIEDYDARKDESGWLQCDYNDSHWRNACSSEINNKGWVMKPQDIPEGNVHEEIIPIPVTIQKVGLQVFDTGKIVTGWPRFKLPGIEGIQVRMRYSEDLDEEGRVKHNVCNEKSEHYYDQYTMRGNAEEFWEPCFSYKAFRYVEITGYPELIKPENIRIVSAGTGLTYEGYFNSSNSLLNNIYYACIKTQKNNVLGQLVDCPHREQAQYLADSDLQAETFIYNFTDSSLLEKVLLDFLDAQNQDGRFPFVFPTNTGNPEFDIKIPEWDLHYVTMLWKVYYAYANENTLNKCYDAAKKMTEHYLNIRDTMTGLLPKGIGFPKEWNISDWPYPNIDETGEFLTVQNCLFYHVLGLMSKIAATLGFVKDATDFIQHATILKEAIVTNLYQPDKKRFVDCSGSEQSHQGTNVVAYQYGLIPTKDKEAVLEYIVDEKFDCSTLLSLNLLQVLFENGKGAVAYNILNRREYPGWGYMIARGYKTIWEGFQDIESHSHAWNAYPARVFVEYIVGIRAAAPGFKEIEIRPFIPSGLKFAEGKVPTIQGTVYVRWDVDESRIDIKINIPAGTIAHIYLPKTSSSIETVSGPGEYTYSMTM